MAAGRPTQQACIHNCTMNVLGERPLTVVRKKKTKLLHFLVGRYTFHSGLVKTGVTPPPCGLKKKLCKRRCTDGRLPRESDSNILIVRTVTSGVRVPYMFKILGAPQSNVTQLSRWYHIRSIRDRQGTTCTLQLH